MLYIQERMTKKILQNPDESNINKELLLPLSNLGSGYTLVGVLTKQKYVEGMVVFTGVDLTADVLAEKTKKSGIEVNHNLFSSYLNQITKFKISKLVRA